MKDGDDTTKYIWALEEINKSLIIGLESAITVMDKWDEMPHEKRESIVDNLRNLVERTKQAYGKKPVQH